MVQFVGDRLELAQWECNLLRNKFYQSQKHCISNRKWDVNLGAVKVLIEPNERNEHTRRVINTLERRRNRFQKGSRVRFERIFNKLNILKVMMQRSNFMAGTCTNRLSCFYLQLNFSTDL